MNKKINLIPNVKAGGILGSLKSNLDYHLKKGVTLELDVRGVNRVPLKLDVRGVNINKMFWLPPKKILQ